MRFDALRWWLIPAIALHNLEEWLTVGTYGSLDGGLLDGLRESGPPPSQSQLEVALLLATIVPALVVLVSARGRRSPLKDWLVCLVACVFLANAFLPHIPASIVRGGYTAGVASAVLVNIPLAVLLLRAGLAEGRLRPRAIAAAVLGGAFALPVSLALIWPLARALAG